jgi:hypothetical protein
MAQTTGFHIGKWGFWGWLETAVKSMGILAGLIAFFNTSNVAELTIGGNPELGAIAILALFTLVAFAVIFLRIGQKEIISIVFWIGNFIGHTAMLIALLRVPQDTTLGIVFGIAYMCGEFVKQRWLYVTGYTESGQSTQAITTFSRGLAFLYFLYVVFLVI